ncbi:MAG TPA: VOC family protein [Mycobacterium sp.]|jgi:catechol 2,3-dioxygenase-like lactoylglutathione lyase family enzyme
MIRFHHIGITVRDIEASYRFYCDVVGMRVWDQDAQLGTHNPDRTEVTSTGTDVTFLGIQSEAFDKLTDNPGSVFKYINLELPDGFVLQLIEYIEAGGPALELNHNRAGSPHLSVFVDDVEAKYQEILRHPGIEPVSAIIDIAPGMRSFYVHDPDGVPVEFLQLVR